MIVVIDYGMGNLGSIINMLRKFGTEVMLSSRPDDLLPADRLILPGVGAFDAGMRNLRQMGYLDILNHKVIQERTPILGICLGMQLFSRCSEEGLEPGLGWIDAETIRFRFSDANQKLKIPHMGWNTVRASKETPLFSNPEQEKRFYFVHSYHVRCNNSRDILTTTNYGFEFTSAVSCGNILGTQFHPEKSHRFGLEFFKAFLARDPSSP